MIRKEGGEETRGKNMAKVTHLALLCAVVAIGMLIPPVMAVESAQGEHIYHLLNYAQDRPDIDGNVIVWEDSRNGQMDIYSGTIERFRESSGYTGEQITTDPASQEKPSISGDHIVWQDNRSGDWDIYLYKRSKREVIPLTEGEAGNQWMPIVHGNYIAWYDDSSGKTKIVLYDIAAGNVKKVIDCNAQTKIPGGKTEFKPALSGAYVAWVERGEEKVRYYDIGADSMGFVSAGGGDQSWPSLSGSLMAWEDYRNGSPDIYMIDLANPSGGERRITYEPSDQVSAAISGDIVAWEDLRSKGPDGTPGRGIYLYDLTSGEEKSVRLPDGNYDEHLYPAVSGTNIVWQRGASPNSNLYIFVYEPAASVEPVVTTIKVTPSAATLGIGETRAFQATVLDQDGNTMTGVAITWACSDSTIGTIDAGGLFTAKAVGTTTLTASAGEVSGPATVTVTADESILTRIEVTPSEATLGIGETRAFQATVLDQFDNTMTGVAITWACSDSTIGTIDADGLFTAKAVGTTTLTASAGEVSGPATVTVTADESILTRIEVTPSEATLGIGETRAFQATVLDQFDNTMTGVAITWACSDSTIGTIDADGLFTAKAVGTTTLTASAGEISGTAAVTVTAATEDPTEPVLTSLKVMPPRATLAVGDGQKFIVIACDQSGNILSVGDVAWTSSDPIIGTIDTSGYFTALSTGITTITATAGDLSAEATITVAAAEPALAKVVVVPSTVILDAGDTLQFEAIAFNCYGEVVPDAELTWTSSDPSVGTIDECGLFVALCTGMTTIAASGDCAAGTAMVTVACDEAVLARIDLSPPAITLNVGDAATFTATAYDQHGNTMPDAAFTWASSNEDTGTIDADGDFNALDAGIVTITAVADGVAGTADVTVVYPAPGVVVSPPAVTLDEGETWQFTAALGDMEDGITASQTVTWSCDDESVGTIDEDGLFVALSEGTATITATIDGSDEIMPVQIGETGTAVVTVRSVSAVPARIAVNPSDFTIPAGETLLLTATVYDCFGNAMPEVDVTWESSNSCVGTIDGCGLFTAIKDGEVTLTASADDISGSACVTVEPSIAVPACIEVDPVTAALAPGGTREFIATVFDQCDNRMDWVRVIWSCSDPAVGTIDRAGLFAAYACGTADVKARAGCVEGAAAISVTAAPASDDPGKSDGPAYHDWGGGGGDSGPTFDTGMCEDLMRGETFTFSGATTSSIDSIAITAAKTIPKLMVTVKEGKAPSGTEKPADGIYEYVEITLYWANPDDIESAVIEFTIPADWLSEHGMTPEDVVLMRCVGGVWQPLDTVLIGEEGGVYRFRATTPGFSTFAIAAPAPANTTVTAGTNATTGGETNATTNVTAESTTVTTTVPATTTPAAPLVCAPLLAPFAFLLWRRRKN